MDTNPSEDVDLDALVDAVAPTPPPVKALTEDELQFVTFMHQIFALEGTILSQEAARETLHMPPKEYDRLMSDPLVLAALDERGVKAPVPTPVGKDSSTKSISAWSKQLKLTSLTPQQLLVANSMLDLVDTRSQKKKLQDLGVPTATFNMWLKDPVFQQYIRERAESMLGENQHEAHLALLDKVRMGDIKAITLYYEMQGIYTQASASQVNAQQVAVDVQNLIVSIIEIITDEVDDFQVAARISDRMKGLIQARTIANELVNNHIGADGTVIHQPKVVKSPELSDDLKVLMGRTDPEEPEGAQ